MATIPNDLNFYAIQAASQTGLDYKVILSQWIAENGWTTPKNFNFGNIMVPGTHTVETYSNGLAGVDAYVKFLQQSNYKGIMATAGGTPTAQMAAIVASPWDAGHYGGDGSSLVNVYNSVAGASLGPTTAAGHGSGETVASTQPPSIGLSNQLKALQGTAQGSGTGWAAQAQGIGLMVVLAGLGLIFLFVGLKLVSSGGATAIIREAVS
jgi:hypothetical protein